jgi:hypothetical protein
MQECITRSIPEKKHHIWFYRPYLVFSGALLQSGNGGNGEPLQIGGSLLRGPTFTEKYL